MNDIAPELYENIKTDFEAFAKSDRTVRKVRFKADKGTANYRDAYDYAVALGACLSRAFRRNIKADELPDGRMYYNIAERTVRPMLEQLEDMVADLTAKVQEGLNTKAGLGLKSV